MGLWQISIGLKLFYKTTKYEKGGFGMMDLYSTMTLYMIKKDLEHTLDNEPCRDKCCLEFIFKVKEELSSVTNELSRRGINQ